MPSWLIGAIIGAAVAAAYAIMAGKDKKLVPAIEEKLRASPAGLTLPEVATAIGMGGFYAKGKVAMALNGMHSRGEVEIVPAPDGTPQLEKVNHIRYKIKAKG